MAGCGSAKEGGRPTRRPGSPVSTSLRSGSRARVEPTSSMRDRFTRKSRTTRGSIPNGPPVESSVLGASLSLPSCLLPTSRITSDLNFPAFAGADLVVLRQVTPKRYRSSLIKQDLHEATVSASLPSS